MSNKQGVRPMAMMSLVIKQILKDVQQKPLLCPVPAAEEDMASRGTA